MHDVLLTSQNQGGPWSGPVDYPRFDMDVQVTMAPAVQYLHYMCSTAAWIPESALENVDEVDLLVGAWLLPTNASCS